MDDHGPMIRSLRRRGMSFEQIAEAVGVSVADVQASMVAKRPPPSADPNELLIQLTASAIRMTWTPSERVRRHYMSEWRLKHRDPVSISQPRFSRN
jgi:hypothetical protein